MRAAVPPEVEVNVPVGLIATVGLSAVAVALVAVPVGPVIVAMTTVVAVPDSAAVVAAVSTGSGASSRTSLAARAVAASVGTAVCCLPSRNRSRPPVVRRAKNKSRPEAKRKGVNCLIVFFRRWGYEVRRNGSLVMLA